jgi:hypothetical protein
MRMGERHRRTRVRLGRALYSAVFGQVWTIVAAEYASARNKAKWLEAIDQVRPRLTAHTRACSQMHTRTGTHTGSVRAWNGASTAGRRGGVAAGCMPYAVSTQSTRLSGASPQGACRMPTYGMHGAPACSDQRTGADRLVRRHRERDRRARPRACHARQLMPDRTPPAPSRPPGPRPPPLNTAPPGSPSQTLHGAAA